MTYHDDEYAIACDPTHPSHLMPTIGDEVRAILDVGCGAGQTLAAISRSHPHVSQLDGFDMDTQAIAYGQRKWPTLSLRVGTEHFVPYMDGTYDLVLSRVALPYMDIPKTLDEMTRVLKPGGHLWLALHTWRYVVKELTDAAGNGEGNRVLLMVFVLLNGLSLHWFGRAWYVLGRCESWQGKSRMVGLLWARGYTIEAVTNKGTVLILAATKGAG